MTVRQKVREEGFRKSVTFWGVILASMVSIVNLGGLVFAGGEFKTQTNLGIGRLEKDLGEVKDSFAEHIADEDKHMPYREKVQTFVLKSEWDRLQIKRDRELEEVKKSALRTEGKVEKIYDILRSQHQGR